MIEIKQKKHIIAVTLVFLYVVFYLFSPFIHSHDRINGNISNNYYHTHLYDNIHNEKNDPDHHSYHNNDDHNHLHIINSVVTIPAPRFQNLYTSVVLLHISFNLESGNELSQQNIIEENLKTKLSREKCIHSASNVSPPKVLTA